MVKKAPVSAVDAIIPMVNGSTNPAISLSAIISFLFFAKVAIIFITLHGLAGICFIIPTACLEKKLTDYKNDNSSTQLRKLITEVSAP